MILKLADNFPVDLDRLLASRLLVQARSGAGKSWLLRLLLELALKHVQCIVIDPEGEFATLREAFDVLLCAPSGADLEATPRTAATLARRLLETRASAVLDIYDLEKHHREDFVRRFCEALINAPKDEKRLALVVVDEAHLFVPEGDRSECGRAVVDVATRGRKRGLCLCLATQRLSKLNKDAAAELGNKLIGGTNLDLDVKRAADELGKGAKEILPVLRDLQPGEFFGYGPAFPPGVVRFKAGTVQTTHPQPGKRVEAPREPSAKIRKLLAEELKDLPRQAETQAKTEEDLRAENRSLRAKLAHAEKAAPINGKVPKDVLDRAVKQAATRAHQEGLVQGRQEATEASERRGLFPGVRELKVLREGAECVLALLDGRAERIGKAYDKAPEKAMEAMAEKWKAPKPEEVVEGLVRAVNGIGSTRIPISGETRIRIAKEGEDPHVKIGIRQVVDPGDLPEPRQQILDALAKMGKLGVDQVERPALGALCGKSASSSGFQNNLGALRTAGLVTYPTPGSVALSDSGKQAARQVEYFSAEDLRAAWLEIVSAPQAKILQVLIDAYPDSLSRAEIAEVVDNSAESSGFQNNLGRLRSLQAVEYPGAGTVRASDLLFPEKAA